ncbi:class D sortase [[Eubacterium] hominis]|uniref:class D sortase n=1 Tax=[Eubacterium] hominis TaxID=2764325 RepID=UPI003A4E0C41
MNKKNNLLLRLITIVCSCIICIVIVSILRVHFQNIYQTQYEQGKTANVEVIKEVKTQLSNAEEKIDISSITIPKEGDAYATISVDRVNFKKPLYYGDNDVILNLGIGHYMGSGLPGQGKPILLAGHNGTEFYQLQNMKKDDIVNIKTEWGTYTYKIYDIEIMAATDFDANVLDDNSEYLIMYSCYPFDVADTPDRYFVYASYVSGPLLKGGNVR